MMIVMFSDPAESLAAGVISGMKTRAGDSTFRQCQVRTSPQQILGCSMVLQRLSRRSNVCLNTHLCRVTDEVRVSN